MVECVKKTDILQETQNFSLNLNDYDTKGSIFFNWKIVAKRYVNNGSLRDKIESPTFSFSVKSDNSLPTNGLVAYYPFNGNANDESGNGNNGIVHGAILTTDRHGNPNRAYSFDGKDDYIKILNSSSLENINESLTISVWVKSDNYLMSPICKSNKTDLHFRIQTYYPNTPEIIYSNKQNNYFIKNKIPLKEWFNIIVVFNESEGKLYLNGKLQKNIKNTNNKFNNISDLFIGMDLQGAIEYHNGQIDDIRIYNRALTAEEVQALYNE